MTSTPAHDGLRARAGRGGAHDLAAEPAVPVVGPG